MKFVIARWTMLRHLAWIFGFLDSVVLRSGDTRLAKAQYFNQVVNGRGYVPAGVDRQSRIAQLSALIVTANSQETIGSGANIWKIDNGLNSVLGLVRNEYRNTTQSADANKAYKALAQDLWKSRKNLGKFLFFKSAKRKAYETLCKQLPL